MAARMEYIPRCLTTRGGSPQLVIISDDRKQYDTQETAINYRSKASGINYFRDQGARYVLTTRNDGEIRFPFPKWVHRLVMPTDSQQNTLEQPTLRDELSPQPQLLGCVEGKPGCSLRRSRPLSLHRGHLLEFGNGHSTRRWRCRIRHG